MSATDSDQSAPGESAHYLELSRRAAGTNVNPRTLLATDYLNHFNEIAMMLELVPDAPECLEEAKAWRPKSYRRHFLESGVADRALAIEAYDHVPMRYREPFEATVAETDAVVLESVARIEAAAASEAERLQRLYTESARRLQRLIERLSAIIHGDHDALAQGEIDALVHPAPE